MAGVATAEGARVEEAAAVDERAVESQAAETKEAQLAEAETTVAHCLACAVATTVQAPWEVGWREAGLQEVG